MKSNIRRLIGTSLTVLASAALIFSHPAQAHHSAAPFDFAKTVTIEGTVKSFEVMNPHTQALVTLSDANGTRDIDFEGHSASNFYRAGYVKGAVQPGDHIRNTNGVGVAKRPAPKWSPTGTHDHGKVYVRRIGYHLFRQAACGLIDHHQD